jgi:hypothetical protein
LLGPKLSEDLDTVLAAGLQAGPRACSLTLVLPTVYVAVSGIKISALYASGV